MRSGRMCSLLGDVKITCQAVDYIEVFYNPNSKHSNNGMLSPVDYKSGQCKLNKAARDTSVNLGALDT